MPLTDVEEFQHIRVGDRVDECTVVRIGNPHLGAVSLILEDRLGERFQVDVLRRDDRGPAPLETTRYLALYLSNNGQGSLSTPEGHALTVRTLARSIAEREQASWSESLLTYSERIDKHPDGNFRPFV